MGRRADRTTMPIPPSCCARLALISLNSRRAISSVPRRELSTLSASSSRPRVMSHRGLAGASTMPMRKITAGSAPMPRIHSHRPEVWKASPTM